MRLIAGYAGIYDMAGELYGIELEIVASLTADQMTHDAGRKRVYHTRPVTIIEGDAMAELRKLGIHEAKA